MAKQYPKGLLKISYEPHANWHQYLNEPSQPLGPGPEPCQASGFRPNISNVPALNEWLALVNFLTMVSLWHTWQWLAVSACSNPEIFDIDQKTCVIASYLHSGISHFAYIPDYQIGPFKWKLDNQFGWLVKPSLELVQFLSNVVKAMPW